MSFLPHIDTSLPLVSQELAHLASVQPPGCLTSPEAFLAAMPKAELHLHSTAMTELPGTAEIAWRESQKSDGALQTRFGTSGSLLEYFRTHQCGTLEEYLRHYDILKPYMIRDLGVIRELSERGARECFEKGVRILEIRTSIKSGKHGDSRSRDKMQGVTFTPFEELCARIEGFQKAERDFPGHRAYLLISFRRQDSPADLMELLHEVVKYRRFLMDRFGQDYLLGVDIAGQEYGSFAKRFEAVFQAARGDRLSVTAHAGEELGAGEGSIRHALNAGAQRIGHGTSLYLPTPMLMKENVRQNGRGIIKNPFILALMFGTPFEMCLTSNLACGAGVTRGYQVKPGTRSIEPRLEPFREFADYPADILMALGALVYHGRKPIVPVPCTDGIYTLNTNIVREYALAAATFGWGVKEILAVARESIRSSFAPPADKARALRAWHDFAKDYLIDDRQPSPEAEAEAALTDLRARKRRQLRITSAQMEEIVRHVHSPDSYFNGDFLQQRFKRHLARMS